MSTLNTSLVEEVARQAVCSRATGAEIGRLPQCVSGTMTWLSILYKFENLSSFDILLGEGVEYLNGDKATVHNTGSKICSAVSSIYNMRIGSHFAEFEIIDANSGMPFIGIVRPMPGLNSRVFFEEDHYFIGNSNAYPDFLEQRSDEWGVGGVHACEYFCGTGGMSWTSWVEDEDEEEQTLLAWQGREACLPGDTIGMHLNLDEGTLTVYKNNRRLGVMKDGLSGSYFWYVSVWGGAAISIKRGEPPRA
ncbi:hypothetical protein THAOC_09915 [Thalassiosira oceanica]|uniref:B30.2/SPRY domain-containing protein n=1 Tax=Thalassiosira oceanica TaxID=159749 RepID=K0STY5_THAOC|nr:hypothetical protein THAOC_09915 [Thalassiosira oceanica]|eukprot:EJK68870.1 hypothetical protein THAOC_09915 [Thalassiosira oceanica]